MALFPGVFDGVIVEAHIYSNLGEGNSIFFGSDDLMTSLGMKTSGKPHFGVDVVLLWRWVYNFLCLPS